MFLFSEYIYFSESSTVQFIWIGEKFSHFSWYFAYNMDLCVWPFIDSCTVMFDLEKYLVIKTKWCCSYGLYEFTLLDTQMFLCNLISFDFGV